MIPTKSKLIILAIALFCVGVFIDSRPKARAVDPNVFFESVPLFKEVNFLPGQTVQRWVRVKNVTDAEAIAGAKALDFKDVDSLGGQLFLTIKKGPIAVYSGTLHDFLTAGEVELSAVVPGETAQYDFSVLFKPDSGNEFKEKTVGFDFQVGFLLPD